MDTPSGSGYKDPYLTRQLIAYIGNKRRLLPFLGEVFSFLDGEKPVRTFLDPFAGSGAVSRLGRTLGFEVVSGDWEFYSWVVCAAHVGLSLAELPGLFVRRGGIREVFRELNRLGHQGPGPRNPYISVWYAPEDTEAADFRTERLFYTRENALFLDRVRETVEDWYPGWELEETDRKEKLVLTAALIYQGATRANTSGVFKSCHKGFGGHGKDALSRIMAPMELEIPVLTDRGRGEALLGEAGTVIRGRPADLCYLDPPYNIHQYGSNYHLLNTLGLWDRPPVDSGRDAAGGLLSKAGIRQDWIRTRSPYCSRGKAQTALKELLEGIDARTIVLSYSTDGVIPFPELMEILSRRGEPELFARDYVMYRGGRQSLSRKTYNVEFQLVIRTGRSVRPGNSRRASRFLEEYRFLNLLQEGFHPARLAAEFPLEEGRVLLRKNPESGERLALEVSGGYRFLEIPGRALLEEIPDGEFTEILKGLERAVCRDRQEEAEVLLRLMADAPAGKVLRNYGLRFLQVFRKFAHRKYREQYQKTLDEIRSLLARRPRELAFLEARLQKLGEVALRRFDG